MLYFFYLKLFLERGFLFPPLKSVGLDFHSESQEEEELHTNDTAIEVKGSGECVPVPQQRDLLTFATMLPCKGLSQNTLEPQPFEKVDAQREMETKNIKSIISGHIKIKSKNC